MTYVYCAGIGGLEGGGGGGVGERLTTTRHHSWSLLMQLSSNAVN